MNTEMNIRVPLNSENLFNIDVLLASQGGFCFVELAGYRSFCGKVSLLKPFVLKFFSYNPVQKISLNSKFITQWHFSPYSIIASLIDLVVKVLLYATPAPSSTLGLDTPHADSN